MKNLLELNPEIVSNVLHRIGSSYLFDTQHSYSHITGQLLVHQAEQASAGFQNGEDIESILHMKEYFDYYASRLDPFKCVTGPSMDEFIVGLSPYPNPGLEERREIADVLTTIFAAFGHTDILSLIPTYVES